MATRKRRYVDEDYGMNQDVDDDSREDIHPAKRQHHEEESEANSSTHATNYSTPSYEQQNAVANDDPGAEASANNGQGAQGSASGKRRTIRFLISDSSAGAVIGRGGANIKKIREDTGVVVEIEGNYGWESRVVYISGTDEENVVRAFITVFLTSEREVRQFADASGESSEETEAKIREAATVRLLVPDRQVGGLIGRGGENVKRIRETSQAGVDINSAPGLPEGARGLRMVKVQGKLDAVLEAQKMIYDGLQEMYGDDSWHYRNRSDRREGRGGGGRGGGRGFGRGGSSYGDGYGSGRSYGRGRSHGMGGRGRGRGGGEGMRGRGIPPGLDRALSTAPNHGPSYGSDHQGYPPMHSAQGGVYGGETLTPLGGGPGPMQGPMENEVVSVPAESIGKIIGKGGSTVKDIRMRSGCKISIQSAEYGSPIAVITLTGSKPARDSAKYLIRTLL